MICPSASYFCERIIIRDCVVVCHMMLLNAQILMRFCFPRMVAAHTGDKCRSSLGQKIIWLQLALDWFSKTSTGSKSLGGIYARPVNLPPEYLADDKYLVFIAFQLHSPS